MTPALPVAVVVGRPLPLPVCLLDLHVNVKIELSSVTFEISIEFKVLIDQLWNSNRRNRFLTW